VECTTFLISAQLLETGLLYLDVGFHFNPGQSPSTLPMDLQSSFARISAFSLASLSLVALCRSASHSSVVMLYIPTAGPLENRGVSSLADYIIHMRKIGYAEMIVEHQSAECLANFCRQRPKFEGACIRNKCVKSEFAVGIDELQVFKPARIRIGRPRRITVIFP
jgi:hypothetical protein